MLMNALPRDKHSELIEKLGTSILEEPERCRAWLLYSCPEHKKEINVLLSALGQRVPQDLLASGRKEVLVRRMVDDLAMTEEAARWAVESWEMILRNVLPAGSPVALPANGDNTERIQARAPLIGKKLKLRQKPVIRVWGKAFYDAKHQKVSTPNRRRDKPNVTVWEIHPVMALAVVHGGKMFGKWQMTSGRPPGASEIWEFTANGKFSVKMSIGVRKKLLKGTYELGSGDTMELHFNEKFGGSKDHSQIIQIKGDELTMSDPNGTKATFKKVK
jgi:uncharacterized protein (TIGR03066 family)